MADFTSSIEEVKTLKYKGYVEASCGTAKNYEGDWYYNGLKLVDGVSGELKYASYSVKYDGNEATLIIDPIKNESNTEYVYEFTWKSTVISCENKLTLTHTAQGLTYYCSPCMLYIKVNDGDYKISVGVEDITVTATQGYLDNYFSSGCEGTITVSGANDIYVYGLIRTSAANSSIMGEDLLYDSEGTWTWKTSITKNPNYPTVVPVTAVDGNSYPLIYLTSDTDSKLHLDIQDNYRYEGTQSTTLTWSSDKTDCQRSLTIKTTSAIVCPTVEVMSSLYGTGVCVAVITSDNSTISDEQVADFKFYAIDSSGKKYSTAAARHTTLYKNVYTVIHPDNSAYIIEHGTADTYDCTFYVYYNKCGYLASETPTLACPTSITILSAASTTITSLCSQTEYYFRFKAMIDDNYCTSVYSKYFTGTIVYGSGSNTTSQSISYEYDTSGIFQYKILDTSSISNTWVTNGGTIKLFFGITSDCVTDFKDLNGTSYTWTVESGTCITTCYQYAITVDTVNKKIILTTSTGNVGHTINAVKEGISVIVTLADGQTTNKLEVAISNTSDYGSNGTYSKTYNWTYGATSGGSWTHTVSVSNRQCWYCASGAGSWDFIK
jgi:hypothetical protein